MSYRKLFWGILLVIIGLLFILKNMGVIFFDWWTIWRMWPLILILWGIALIPVKDYIKLILSLVAIAAGFILVSKYDTSDRPFMHWNKHGHNWSYNSDYDDNDSTYYSEDFQELFQDYDSTITAATLNFDAAAGDYRIADSLITDKLLLFRKRGNIGDYSMTTNDDAGVRNIDLKINESNVKLENRGNEVQLYLNQQPAWNFNFDIGAANIDFDLSKYKVNKLDVEGGASSINLKLGDLVPESIVNIEAGAASIDIDVPTTAGVEIKTETVLTSRNFPGFRKISKGHYKTDNFETATSIILIDVNAGVSSLNINRY